MNRDGKDMIMQVDMEKLNRNNFRSLLQALSRPGTEHPLSPLYGSLTMAAASLLLYPEVTFFEDVDADWPLIQALTGSVRNEVETADYLFFDDPSLQGLWSAKTGDSRNPESSATLLIRCPELHTGSRVVLSGPGIDGCLETILPVSRSFLDLRAVKNRHFPSGVDCFFLSDTKEVMGVPRSTVVKIL